MDELTTTIAIVDKSAAGALTTITVVVTCVPQNEAKPMRKKATTRVVLAEREAEIMRVLWDEGPATVAEVKDRLAAPLAYTTVLTVLRKLEAKRYVMREEIGRAHKYRAAVDRDLARTSALRALARKLFNDSAALLLTHAVQDRALSEEDLERIRRIIDEQSEKARKK